MYGVLEKDMCYKEKMKQGREIKKRSVIQCRYGDHRQHWDNFWEKHLRKWQGQSCRWSQAEGTRGTKAQSRHVPVCARNGEEARGLELGLGERIRKSQQWKRSWIMRVHPSKDSLRHPEVRDPGVCVLGEPLPFLQHDFSLWRSLWCWVWL